MQSWSFVSAVTVEEAAATAVVIVYKCIHYIDNEEDN